MERTIELAIMSHNGNKKAFNELYEEYTGFIHFITAKVIDKFCLDFSQYDEIHSVRLESFVLKIKKIETEKLEKMSRKNLTTYISKGIEWEIFKVIAKENAFGIYVPKNLSQKSLFYKKYLKNYKQNYGENPSEEIIKAELNINDTDLERLNKSSFFKRQENDQELLWEIKDKSDQYERAENRILLEDLLNKLKKQEKTVIEEIFLKEKIEIEVAKKMKLSQSRINFLKKAGLKKLSEQAVFYKIN